jgi:mono/diheme cytochrome c family protein
MRALVVVAVVVLIAMGAVASQLHGFSTRQPPSALERIVARVARRAAIPRNARTAVNPVGFNDDVWSDARAHFADHCATCHGNDGRGKTELGQNLYPRAPDMRMPDTQKLTDGELYWIIENGVRLTGMPAWGDGSDHDLDTWKLVHFIRHLDHMTPEHLTTMEGLNPKSPGELKEEQDDRDFLDGGKEQPSAESAHGDHHQH